MRVWGGEAASNPIAKSEAEPLRTPFLVAPSDAHWRIRREETACYGESLSGAFHDEK